MNRYQFRVPRVALAMAAVALTALTIGVSVVLPAQNALTQVPFATTEVVEVVVAATRDSLVFRER